MIQKLNSFINRTDNVFIEFTVTHSIMYLIVFFDYKDGV